MQNNASKRKLNIVRPQKKDKEQLPRRKLNIVRKQQVKPKFGNSPDKVVVITHSELIPILQFTTASFIQGKQNGYAINAGSSFTFPWLSAIARNFDKYRFTYLKFALKNRNPVTFSGGVYLALDPDTNDAAPPNASAMLAMRWSKSGVVFQDTELVLDAASCKQLHMPMTFAYTKERSGPDPVTNAYTVGRLWVAATLSQASNFDLMVDYSVELMAPQLISSVPGGTTISDTWAPAAPDTKKYATPLGALPAGWSAVALLGQAGAVGGIDIKKLPSSLISVASALLDTAGAAVAPNLVGPTGAKWELVNEDGSLATTIDSAFGAGYGRLASNFWQPTVTYDTHVDGTQVVLDVGKILNVYPMARWIVPTITNLLAGAYTYSMTFKTEL